MRTLAFFILLSIGHSTVAQDFDPPRTVDTKNRFPGVVLLRESVGRQAQWCTGTFIGKDSVLTAGHCVELLRDRFANANGTEIDLEAAAKQEGKLVWMKGVNAKPESKAKRIFLNPRWSRLIDMCFMPHDVAVVQFEDKSAPASLPLYLDEVTNALATVFVGYGARADEEFGPRRFYDSTVKGNGNWIDTKSRTTPGDSGGPLLIGSAIAGVASMRGGIFAKLAVGANLNVLGGLGHRERMCPMRIPSGYSPIF